MDAPEKTIRAFMDANNAWNTRANQRCRPLPPGSVAHRQAMAVAKSEYHELVARFCASSVVPQGIAFGDNPTHHSEHETITAVSISAPQATIRTLHTGLDNFVSKYEYHLVQESGEWRIASLLYINEDQKYECL
jgi:hypothetical protein